MLASLHLEALFAELQQQPSFRCIDLQLAEEGQCVVVRATVGSIKDRNRLLETLKKVAAGKEIFPLIQIDSLINTPFCPTMPVVVEREESQEALTLPFIEGGAHLTDTACFAAKRK